MADYDTFMVYAGVYSNVDTAEADYQAVKDLYYGTDLIDTFDAAVIGKKESGKVPIEHILDVWPLRRRRDIRSPRMTLPLCLATATDP